MRFLAWGSAAMFLMALGGAPPVAAKSAPVGYVIGDSVLLGARSELTAMGFAVDTVEGRRPARLMSAVRRIPNDGRPLIIHLGTNGPFDKSICAQFVDQFKRERPVVFMTISAPRSWVERSNKAILACVKRFRHSDIRVLPWHRIAPANPNLLYDDRIHLRPEGARFLALNLSELIGAASNTRMRAEP